MFCDSEKQNSPLSEPATMPTETSTISQIDPLLVLPPSIHSLPSLPQEKTEPSSPLLTPSLALDCYFLEFDPVSRKYKPVKINQNSSGFFVKEITELILSYPRVHIKTLPKSTEQNKNPPKIMKPIVFPVFGGKQCAFVYETYEERILESGVEVSDRFLILVCEEFLPYTWAEMVKTIIKKEFQDRTKMIQQREENTRLQENFSSLTNKLCQLASINDLLLSSKKFYFSKTNDIVVQCQQQMKWYLRDIPSYNVLVRLNTLHYHSILLLTLLIYYAVREYKIILLGFKENRHIMSQAVMGLKFALAPVEYCYPLVFASISDSHDDYMDSPVPCLLCYWGEKRECGILRTRFQKAADRETMPSVLIDLNSLTVFNSVASEEEAKTMQAMNSYILGHKKDGKTVVARANRYVKEKLIDSSEIKEDAAIFRQSLAYENYKHSLATQE